ncbi:discoidin domain-containing protein [Caldicellulosiruptor saccharolyticus]|uniref:discoidin domain-containing protein n=1 Tax=Caldicellulosiruptor saccharolyticus TaxID=44001 RepID=UPI00164FE81C|nr:discoidin domain-containing protein [Caldicellulosiruptor saccharolyticus]
MTLVFVGTFFAIDFSKVKAADGTAVINFNKVYWGDFLGVGIQWDPQDGSLPEIDSTMWDKVIQRVDFMNAKFARVMINVEDYFNGSTYNWNSVVMQRLYKILDYCQSRGVTVMLGNWWKPSWASSFTDSRFLTAICDLLNYLRNSKGYTCIRYYNFLNEPNGEWMYGENPPDLETRWNNWKDGIIALHNMLSSRGYTNWVQLVGPDTAYQDDWVDRALNNLGSQMGAYEFHIYKDYDSQVYNGEIEATVGAKRNLINSSTQSNKHLWLGELGMKEGKDPIYDCQPRVTTFEYAVVMSDGIAQVIRAGGSGVIPWCLDDAMHLASSDGTLKKWGMWNSLGGKTVGTKTYPISDQNLRPWFYPVSLFSKFFVQGSQVVEVSGPSIPGVRVAAVKKQNGTNWDVSIVVVNNNDSAKSILITAPGVTNTAIFKQYNFFASDQPKDNDGFPLPKMDRVNNLSNGILVDLPSRGVVFLTTLNGGTPVSVSSNLALNKPAYASSTENSNYPPNYAFDGNLNTRWSSAWSDPQWIYVDLGSVQTISRVKLVWEAAYAKQFQIQVSTDNVNWTTVYSNYNGTGGTNDITFTPVNARYVKMYAWQRATQYGYSLWEFEVYQ